MVNQENISGRLRFWIGANQQLNMSPIYTFDVMLVKLPVTSFGKLSFISYLQ